MATIKDIAKKTGFSIGTVSRVINNKPDVNEKTRAKILKVIEEMHFEPNSNAKFLKQNLQDNITILIKGIGNPFLENLLEKTQTLLTKYDEESNVVFVDEYDDEVLVANRYQTDRNPKGLIFLGGSDSNFRNGFSNIHIPSVLVTKDASDMNFKNLSSYFTDDYEGSAIAAKVLLDNHHKKVGVIAGYLSTDKDGNVTSPRLKGFTDTLAKNKIKFNLKTQVVSSKFSMESAYKATLELMDQEPDITGIFAHSDIMAMGVVRALNDLNKKVPDDVSIIGYDGLALTQYLQPRLTTIRQDPNQLSELAVEDLLKRIAIPKVKVKHQQVALQLIESESVKKI